MLAVCRDRPDAKFLSFCVHGNWGTLTGLARLFVPYESAMAMHVTEVRDLDSASYARRDGIATLNGGRQLNICILYADRGRLFTPGPGVYFVSFHSFSRNPSNGARYASQFGRVSRIPRTQGMELRPNLMIRDSSCRLLVRYIWMGSSGASIETGRPSEGCADCLPR